jgi:NAD(P)-dependent dehydrogenase (short-subunit alcohol dehydrogenase family)
MLKVLPLMKARRSGVIINIASRAGTIDYAGSASYAVSKSAVIRLTGCAQAELNSEGYGDDIQLYCLHPGGVLTDMPKSISPSHPALTLAAIPDDVAAKYPERVKMRNDWLPKFITSRFLCGATVVYLASGKAKVLKGRYFDCEQDIGTVVAAGKEVLDQNLYSLRVNFLGGLPNDGGIAKDPVPPPRK